MARATDSHPTSLRCFVASLPTNSLGALQRMVEKAENGNRLAVYAPYPKQQEFHDAGAKHRERLFMAGNQLGKTLAGGMEWAMHLTGRYLRRNDAGRALVEEWGADAPENIAFAQREAEALLGDMWRVSPSAVVALQGAIRNLTPRQELAVLKALVGRGRTGGDPGGGAAASYDVPDRPAAPSLTGRERLQGRLDELTRLMHSDMRKYQSPAVQRELEQLYARLHGSDPLVGLGGRIA